MESIQLEISSSRDDDANIREVELRSAAHSMIDSLPHQKIVDIAASLPLLQINPHSDEPVQLTSDQVRRCFHGLADIIRFDNAVHGLPCTSPSSWDDGRILNVLQQEYAFAIQVANDFKGKIQGDRHKRRDLDALYSRGYAAINLVANMVKTMRQTDLLNGPQKRAQFLERCALQPPEALRLIDLEASCANGEVCLVEYDVCKCDCMGFTAISHTYGMDIYEIFDCGCTARFSSATMNPRCRVGACSHNDIVSIEANQKRNKLVNDILGMCLILKKAGVHYAWHDGVCIAQHDEAEVTATIKGIGWVYAYAEETIVFLHYVGRPIAILGPGDLMRRLSLDEVSPRWHTRVWTIQEAALSATRRYCVRVGLSPLGECHSLEEFERKISFLYDDNTSSIEVIDEVRLVDMLVEVVNVIRPLYLEFTKKLEMQYMQDMDDLDRILLYEQMWTEIKANEWHKSLVLILKSLVTSFNYLSPLTVLQNVSQRNSKHVGDRINSILALSGVRDFVAHKDNNMEESTLEFFKRQGQSGLEIALFSINTTKIDHVVNKRWIPCLWKALELPSNLFHEKFPEEKYFMYKALDNGKLEVTGEMVCVKVKFIVSLQFDSDATHENFSASQQETTVEDCRNALRQYGQYVFATVLEGYIGEPSQLLHVYMSTLVGHFMIVSRQEPIHRASVVEAIRRDQESLDISIGLQPQTSEIFTAVWPHDPGCSFGNVTSPYINVREGEAFSAHLMLPLGCLTTFMSDWPVLILEGDDLCSPVNKLGWLEVSKLFRACLRQYITNNQPTMTITRLTKIIVN